MARIMDKWGRSRAQIATELGHGTGATVRRCVINNYKEKDNVKEDYKYVSREFAGKYPKILEVKNRRRDAQGRRFATVVVVKPNSIQDEQGQKENTEERLIWLTSVASARLDKAAVLPPANGGPTRRVRHGYSPYPMYPRHPSTVTLRRQSTVGRPLESEESGRQPQATSQVPNIGQNRTERTPARSTSLTGQRMDFFREFRVQSYTNNFREKDLMGRAECIELALDCKLKPELLSRVLQVMIPDMPERKRIPFCELLVEEATPRN
ncbi:hypothetical protein FB107DRAFT_276272 [Schizophyllum commune]